MTNPPARAGAGVMVGSVHDSTQHVDLPEVKAVTRSRALRLPWWVVAGVLLLEASDGYWGGILVNLGHLLLGTG